MTSFFRNSETFGVLQRKVFPSLLKQRTDEPLRVWVLGCSTGQEAYSIAMAFQEFMEKFPRARKLQVFATDLNEALLGKARRGLYAKNLVQDIPAERLRRFFVEEDGGYRVIKSLREAVVFAQQNLMSDPPFSRMDLISCRDLFNYLEPSLQQKALPTFHYALNPEGFLLVGASESISGFTGLFQLVDRKHKIYSRNTAVTRPLHLPFRKKPGEGKRETLANGARRAGVGQLPPPAEQPGGLRGEITARREADRLMVNQFAPPGVLVNDELQVLQFRGPTAAWLEQAPGKASFDVLKMAREGLMLPLRAAIHQAKKENKTVRRENIHMRQNGKSHIANLKVIPLKNLRERCFLILFEEAQESHRGKQSQRREGQPSSPSSRRNAELERELAETRDYLQSIQEEHAASDEELQVSNEEVQSANEELQSINEELETAKEELESSNEELTTVNEEMANRNSELDRLNSDLLNLETSTSLGIVLLARDLTIRRFSVPAKKQFNLMASDIGRPVRSLRHNFVFPDDRSVRSNETHSFPGNQSLVTSAVASSPPGGLEAWLSEVIASARAREREVQDKDGHWYSLRVRPYFTLDNKVDGAVLVVVDITDLKRTEREIKAARDYAEAIIRTARDPLVVLRADLKVEKANEAFYQTFKITPQETENVLIYELDHGQWDIPKLRQLLEEIIPRNSSFNDFEMTHDFDHIGRRTMLLNARRLDSAPGASERILLGIEDITERLHLENALRESEALVALKQAELQIQQQREELTRVSRLAMLGEFSASLAHELNQPLSAIVFNAAAMRHHLSHPAPDLSEVRKILVDILADEHRATKISKGLRQLYRRGSVYMHPLDLTAVVRDLLNLLQHDIAKWEVNLSAELANELPMVDGDSVQLQQVVLNLVTNACNAMADAEPKDRKLLVRTSVLPEGVRVTVADRGPGIPPETLPRIFDSFYTTRLEGMGLGLTICRAIIDSHFGRLWAENNPDGGASFHFTLPAAEASGK